MKRIFSSLAKIIFITNILFFLALATLPQHNQVEAAEGNALNTIAILCRDAEVVVGGDYNNKEDIPGSFDGPDGTMWDTYCSGDDYDEWFPYYLFCDTRVYSHNVNGTTTNGIPFRDSEAQACDRYGLPEQAAPEQAPTNDHQTACLGEGAPCGQSIEFDATYLDCCQGGSGNQNLTCQQGTPGDFDSFTCERTSCLPEGATCSTTTGNTTASAWCCPGNQEGNIMYCKTGSGEILIPGLTTGTGTCQKANNNSCQNRGGGCNNSFDCCIGDDHLWCEPDAQIAVNTEFSGSCQPRQVVNSVEMDRCTCNEASGTSPAFSCYREGATAPLSRQCEGYGGICVTSKENNNRYSYVEHGGDGGKIYCRTVIPRDQRSPVSAPPCAPGALQDGKCTAVLTAFGEIGVEPAEFISRLFGILLAASGAIALILFMRAGYQIMSARGNPEGIKEGREKLVAAILGLMFIIFSFVLLEVIGVDLLRLPNSGNDSTLIPEFGTCDVNNPRCADGLVCNYNGAQGQCQRP